MYTFSVYLPPLSVTSSISGKPISGLTIFLKILKDSRMTNDKSQETKLPIAAAMNVVTTNGSVIAVDIISAVLHFRCEYCEYFMACTTCLCLHIVCVHQMVIYQTLQKENSKNLFPFQIFCNLEQDHC